MLYFLTAVHILLCFFLISLVLLQQGKGADMGAAFGGNSNSVFGASGATQLVVKATTVVTVLFMVTSVLLTRQFGKEAQHSIGVIDRLEGSLLKQEVNDQKDAAKAPGAFVEVTVAPGGTTPVPPVPAEPAADPAAAVVPAAEATPSTVDTVAASVTAAPTVVATAPAVVTP